MNVTRQLPGLVQSGIRTTLLVVLGIYCSTSTWGSPQSRYAREEAALAAVVPMSMPLDPEDYFGRSIAIEGTTLVVGADNDDDGEDDAGAVYVFERRATVWEFQAKLTAGGGAPSQALEHFGSSVAISNQTIVVGASGNATNGTDSGAAYVYVFDSMTGSWVQQGAPLIGSGVAEADHFGGRVAIDGDRIVVGARFADVSHMGSTLFDAGRAHVFERTGTVWTEPNPPIEADDGQGFDAAAFDEFGHALAISGSTIVIGAPREDAGQNDDSGAAYVYEFDGTNWIAEQKLVPSARFAFAQFGDCVSLSGERIAVGAPLDLNGSELSGSASVFERAGATWTEQATFAAADSADNDRFGDCLSLQGDTLVVGAWNDLHQHHMPNGPFTAIGSAYVFEQQAGNWNETLKFCPAGGMAHGRFGAAVALDLDRMAVGAWQANALAGDAHAYLLGDLAPLDYCSGDGGNQMGCTNCPCMNNAPQGTVGGCLNSAMTSVRISASGDPSVSLPPAIATDLRFGLQGAPPGALCVMMTGEQCASIVVGHPCLGLNSGSQAAAFDGLRCAVTNTRRLGSRTADGAGAVGVTNDAWGGESPPGIGLAKAQGGYGAGQSVFFQVILRDDPAAVCMKGLTTSQAVLIMFVP